MARIILRHEEDALDAVQEAMMQLVRSYSRRPATEWKPLFYRILENKIRDLQRRRKVRGRVMAWLPFVRGEGDEEPPDPVAQAPDCEPGPARRLELDEAMQALDSSVRALPARQQQAFMLRSSGGAGRRADRARHELLAGQREDTLFPRAAHPARAIGGAHMTTPEESEAAAFEKRARELARGKRRACRRPRALSTQSGTTRSPRPVGSERARRHLARHRAVVPAGVAAAAALAMVAVVAWHQEAPHRA